MNLNRKESMSRDILGKTKVDNVEKVAIKHDIGTLNAFCRFVISDSRAIKKSHLINMRNVLESLDLSAVQSDESIMDRYKIIALALNARLDKQLTNREMIISDINLGLGKDANGVDKDINKIIDTRPEAITMKEIEWVNGRISSDIRHKFMYKSAPKMAELCTRFMASDYTDKDIYFKEYEEFVDRTKDAFRKSKVDSTNDMTFSLRADKFENAVTETYDLITSPNRRLLTMMQGFNQLLNGGFENSRCYMLLGTTGVGKSIAAMNIANQVRKANPYYKPKDPSKTPCIVMLTMENSVVESITRLFEITTMAGEDMSKYSVDTVIKMLKEQGQLELTDEFPIDIIIKYKGNRSVDTGYLYSMCDDLEDDGYEVVMVIQDHVKRIRSTEKTADIRLELGAVVNQFKSFAIDKDIPFLTIGHLNRQASQIKEEAEAHGRRQDITKKISGKSNVGESYLMLDNIDGAYTINIANDSQGVKYLEIATTKQRENQERHFIAQPFEKNAKGENSITLVEDLYTAPAFKDSLQDSGPMASVNATAKIRGDFCLNNMVVKQIAANKAKAAGEFSELEKVVESKHIRINPRKLTPPRPIDSSRPEAEDIRELLENSTRKYTTPPKKEKKDSKPVEKTGYAKMREEVERKRKASRLKPAVFFKEADDEFIGKNVFYNEVIQGRKLYMPLPAVIMYDEPVKRSKPVNAIRFFDEAEAV